MCYNKVIQPILYRGTKHCFSWLSLTKSFGQAYIPESIARIANIAGKNPIFRSTTHGKILCGTVIYALIMLNMLKKSPVNGQQMC